MGSVIGGMVVDGISRIGRIRRISHMQWSYVHGYWSMSAVIGRYVVMFSV
jgi:hypothetical protein